MVKQMKNLDTYDEPILSKAYDQSTYVSLTDVSDARIAKDEIDVIKEFPSATEIAITGLTQDTFEYFVENYGQQFKAIIFWKCPLVSSLKAMEYLDQVEYIVYFGIRGWTICGTFPRQRLSRGFVTMISHACMIFLKSLVRPFLKTSDLVIECG